MSDFLNHIKTMDASRFDARKEFGGRRVASEAMTSEYAHKLAQAQVFTNKLREGRYSVREFREAMSSSDFPYLMAANMQNQLLANYTETPVTWESWARKVLVNDFRELELDYLNGGDGRLVKKPEYTEPEKGNASEGKYTVSVDVYGRIMELTEETIQNDNLGAFLDLPSRLGRGARRTEEYLATTQIAGTAGPNGTLFTSDQGNLITRALSVQGLKEATAAMATMTDAGSEPIYNEPAVLAVVPALKVTAMEILNATQIETTAGKSKTVSQNPFSNLKLVVLPYAPTVMSSSNLTTSWFLMADPDEGRGAAAVAKLRGAEQPGVYMKAMDAIRTDGGGYDVVNFDSDSVQYKVKHAVGATQLDYRYAVGSNGTVAAA
jgi:hypothetical protein